MKEAVNTPSPPKVFVKTFGCQMNVHDSERMVGLLIREGFTSADSPHKAQVILINTCAVREKPERKLLAELGRLKKLKERNPDLIIGVTGCMAPRDGELIRQKAPFVDILLGPRSLHRLPELVRTAQRLRQPVEAIDLSDDPTPLTPIRRSSTISAWVDVIFGCSFACTFCAVPSARGPERSRLPEDILTEVAELKSLGYREITLLGQTVNAYGRDWYYRIPPSSRLFDQLKETRQRVDFAWLLKEIDRVVDGSMRVRFTSPHPTLFPPQLIEAIANLSSICEHIHLPLQSADDEVLKRMRRAYTYGQYRQVVDRLRSKIPHLAITTDIIVGFPGESDQAFRKTLKAMEEIEFDQAFTFIYSPRRHTEAALMEDQVPYDEANRRLQELLHLSKSLFERKNQALVGSSAEVLVEGVSEKDPHRLCGRTRSNKMVVFDLPDANGNKSSPRKELLIGQLVKVQLTTARLWGWEGVLRG